jgi:hypothetical protein
LALAFPLSRFTRRVGGGSPFYVTLLDHEELQTHIGGFELLLGRLFSALSFPILAGKI